MDFLRESEAKRRTNLQSKLSESLILKSSVFFAGLAGRVPLKANAGVLGPGAQKTIIFVSFIFVFIVLFRVSPDLLFHE